MGEDRPPPNARPHTKITVLLLSPAGGLTVVGTFVVEFESKKGVLDVPGDRATEARSLPHNNPGNPHQLEFGS
jgi:hypothetical protein